MESAEAMPLPLVEQYDLHDFIANLSRVDDSLAPHVKYGIYSLLDANSGSKRQQLPSGI